MHLFGVKALSSTEGVRKYHKYSVCGWVQLDALLPAHWPAFQAYVCQLRPEEPDSISYSISISSGVVITWKQVNNGSPPPIFHPCEWQGRLCFFAEEDTKVQ